MTDSLHTSVDLNKDQKQHPPTRSDSSSGVISGDPLVASESDVSRGPGPEQSPTAPSLYQIAKMLHHIELSIIEGGGELTPELEFISEVTTLVRERKVDSYAGILDRCASLITEYKTKADMLYSVANSATKLTKRLKDNLKLAMDIIGTDELQGDSVRFKLKRGKPKVVIFDETVVPDKFWKVVTTRVIDLEAVSNAIQTFEDVPGAQLAETKTLNKYAAKKELK